MAADACIVFLGSLGTITAMSEMPHNSASQLTGCFPWHSINAPLHSPRSLIHHRWVTRVTPPHLIEVSDGHRIEHSGCLVGRPHCLLGPDSFPWLLLRDQYNHVRFDYSAPNVGLGDPFIKAMAQQNAVTILCGWIVVTDKGS